MKKFFKRIVENSGTASSSRSSSLMKYRPEVGVPEVSSLGPAPAVHRGTLRWEVADFGGLLRLKTKPKHHPLSITSARLTLPTAPWLPFLFTFRPEGFFPEDSVDLEGSLGLRLQVLSVPKGRALITYRLLVLNGKSRILISGRECTKEFKAMDAVFFKLNKSKLMCELLNGDNANSTGNNNQNVQPLHIKDSKVVFVCEITARTSYNEGYY